MKSIMIILVLLAFLCSGVLVHQITAGEAPDGKSLFEQKCNSCHSLAKTTSKKKTPEGWAVTVKRMRVLMDKKDKNWLNDDEEKIITDYLAKEYKK